MIECKRANGQIQRATEFDSVAPLFRSDTSWLGALTPQFVVNCVNCDPVPRATGNHAGDQRVLDGGNNDGGGRGEYP
jgi:hypothetical protein